MGFVVGIQEQAVAIVVCYGAFACAEVVDAHPDGLHLIGILIVHIGARLQSVHFRSCHAKGDFSVVALRLVGVDAGIEIVGTACGAH